jgi:hypothetical protein
VRGKKNIYRWGVGGKSSEEMSYGYYQVYRMDLGFPGGGRISDLSYGDRREKETILFQCCID